jgi:hypothetical protein
MFNIDSTNVSLEEAGQIIISINLAPSVLQLLLDSGLNRPAGQVCVALNALQLRLSFEVNRVFDVSSNILTMLSS